MAAKWESKNFKERELGVQSWSPFVTRKSGHTWRIWAEMTQTPLPKSTKVAPNSLARAQFHQNSPNLAEFHQISANIRKNCQISTKIRQISQILFHKRALTLNTRERERERWDARPPPWLPQRTLCHACAGSKRPSTAAIACTVPTFAVVGK